MKRAIVIGATSGIGRALAERLAAEGYRVGVTGRREALLEELAASRPGSFCYAAADIMDPAAACAALERLAGELGGMDLCVVSAGTGDLNPGLDYALEEPAIRTNVVGWTAAVDWAYGRFEEHVGRGPARRRCGSGLQRLESLSDQLCRGPAAAGCEVRTAPPGDRHPSGIRRDGDGQGRGAVLGDARRPGRRRRSVAVVTRRWRLPAWLIRHMPECIYRKMG